MLIDIIDKNGYKIIDVKEKRIDASNVSYFKDIILDTAKKTDNLIIDFSTVEFVDSSVLSTLIYLYKVCQKGNKKIYIAGLSNKLWNLFDITGLTTIFKIFSNVNECVD
jgi:anti-sigma B factor antagonist